MDPSDPRREDKTDALGAPADQASASAQGDEVDAAPRDPSAAGSGRMIRMPRQSNDDWRGPKRAGDPRANRVEPLIISMSRERAGGYYDIPRARSAFLRHPLARRCRSWTWIAGAGVGLASLAAAISLGWAVGTTKPAADADGQRALIDAVGALQHKIATLETASVKKPTGNPAVSAAQLRAAIAQLEARLDAGAGKTAAKLSQLTAQLEKLDAQGAKEGAARLGEITERLDRLHHEIAAHEIVSMETTGSIAKPAPAAAPLPPVRAAYAAPPKDPPPKEIRLKDVRPKAPEPQHALDGWVLRGVHDGTALVEGSSGLREVAPGSLLPGAGRVKSIERHGGNWVVLTTAGFIERAERFD